jgi:hypothetical protein
MNILSRYLGFLPLRATDVPPSSLPAIHSGRKKALRRT